MIYTDGIHLISDISIKELHAFAKKIELNKCWYHSGAKHPHYDLMKSKENRTLMVKRAIENKAKYVTTRELLKILNKK